MFADSHNDIFMKYKDRNSIARYLMANKQSLKKLACAYFSYNNIMNSENIVIDILDKFNIAKEYSYIVSAIENAWFLTPHNIDRIIELQPEYITLVHNESNTLCGGCNSNDGLTMWGKEVVKILQSNNIIIDTAHMSEQAFWEFVDINDKPIFNSHTGLKLWANHKRNLSNEQIKVIDESRGYIGIALYNEFWGKSTLSARDIAIGVSNLMDKYGDNLFGLGTDFNGIDSYPTDIRNYNELVNLKIEMSKLQLGEKEIQKFMCDNYVHLV